MRFNKRNIVIIGLVILMLSMVSCTGREKKYTIYDFEETKEYIKNPYQGPYFQFYTKYPEKLEEESKKNPDCTMVLVGYNLDDEYEMEIIPQEKLEDLHQTLGEIERLGLSAIVRVAYDFIGEMRDPEFSILLGHIEQIAPIINEHKSCIAGVQAGMIGSFGEWNNSKYMEDKSYRLQVVQKWLETLDEDIAISLRRQKFIREVEKAGIDTSRLGVYNDGLFSSESDLGTYTGDYNREEDLKWSDENISVPFNGGEMPFVSEFSHIDNVVKEAALLNLSYLNIHYNTEVWDLWDEESIEQMSGSAYIKQYLGTRLWVESLKISEKFYKKKELEMILHVRNSGFALIDPAYQAYVAYSYNGNEIIEAAEINMTSKDTGTISVVIENPNYKDDVEEIKIELIICKGDMKTIKPDYCIQLANEKISFKDGRNLLLTYKPEVK